MQIECGFSWKGVFHLIQTNFIIIILVTVKCQIRVDIFLQMVQKVITWLVLLQVRLQVVPRGVVVNLADDDARATNDLDGGALKISVTPLSLMSLWFTFTVDFAETGPLAQGLVVTNLQDWDLVLDAQGLDETHVVGLVAVLGQDAKVFD